jgi:hypothetical protein
MFNIFNTWKQFPKHKPYQKGWYCCTVEVKNQQRYIMDLYWYPNIKNGVFYDNIRLNVCETYTVLGCNGTRLTDIGHDRTSDVVAFKKIHRPYMKGFIKD